MMMESGEVSCPKVIMVFMDMGQTDDFWEEMKMVPANGEKKKKKKKTGRRKE